MGSAIEGFGSKETGFGSIRGQQNKKQCASRAALYFAALRALRRYIAGFEGARI